MSKTKCDMCGCLINVNKKNLIKTIYVEEREFDSKEVVEIQITCPVCDETFVRESRYSLERTARQEIAHREYLENNWWRY